jgi:hypothetical protein
MVMGKTLRDRIIQTISLARVASKGDGAFAFLPDIIGSLENMLTNLHANEKARDKMAGALGRLVLEDLAFSESSLGTRLLKLADDFAAYRPRYNKP